MNGNEPRRRAQRQQQPLLTEEMRAERAARREAKIRKQRRQRISRILLTMCMMVLVCALSIGGTLAWLTDSTETVTNTFTSSDINIEISEEAQNEEGLKEFKMVPGNEIAKDPLVTVEGGSEACYLFVEITKSQTPDYDAYLEDYRVITGVGGWTRLVNGEDLPIGEGTHGDVEVYYRLVSESDADQPFYVLTAGTVTGTANGHVKVKTGVTKGMMNALDAEGAAKPTLTFKAYASQSANVADAATAWANAKPTTP